MTVFFIGLYESPFHSLLSPAVNGKVSFAGYIITAVVGVTPTNYTQIQVAGISTRKRLAGGANSSGKLSLRGIFGLE